MNELIKKDKKQIIFGVNYGNYGHKYKSNPKLSLKKAKEFENEIDEKLPEEYLLFLTKVCNGKIGPCYGLFELKKAIKESIENYSYNYEDDVYDMNNLPDYKTCFSDFPISTKQAEKYIYDVEEVTENEVDTFEIDKLTGVLFLSNYGCGHNYILVIKGEQKGTVWFFSDHRDLSPLYYKKTRKQLNFFDWYENWLDESLNELSKTKKKSNEIDTENEKILSFIGTNKKEIPEIVFKCKNLKKLSFASNKISKLPEELFDLANLKVLDIHMNGLKEISPNIGKLSNLIYLNISYNYGLKKLPEEISQLTNLKEIHAAYTNKLQSIPMMIGNLINLKVLNFYYSNLSSIPETIGNLINLEFLSLTNNKKLKKLPETFGNLKNLNKLELSGTILKKLPDSFINLTNLFSLNLETENNFDYDNAFKKISKLPNLHTLKISFQKELPQSIGLLTNIKTLFISYNYSYKDEFKCILPKEIGLLNLEHLIVEPRNVIFPDNLGNLKNLKTLRISDEGLKHFKPYLKEFAQLKEISFSWEIGEKEYKELKEMLPHLFFY